ncbi:hypothetical protein GCM10023340_09860 [Nocardioides marinquilinus]|uniref:Phage holin family protein n=1 Tax=Nocardioides marinquilinus TaxID=1210400 RepID=A0ABP9PBJ6_9ACTN
MSFDDLPPLSLPGRDSSVRTKLSALGETSTWQDGTAGQYARQAAATRQLRLAIIGGLGALLLAGLLVLSTVPLLVVVGIALAALGQVSVLVGAIGLGVKLGNQATVR